MNVCHRVPSSMGGTPRAPTMDPPPAIGRGTLSPTGDSRTTSGRDEPSPDQLQLGCATTSSPPRRCSRRARSTIAISHGAPVERVEPLLLQLGSGFVGGSGGSTSTAANSSSTCGCFASDPSAVAARLRTSQPTRQHDPGQLVCLRAARSVAPMAATSGSSLPVRSI